MNKAELVQAVADRAGSSPAEARRHVDAVLESIVAGVADGERISLVGFGTFDSAARAARTARNPRTGAAIDVPAAVVPRFRVGAAFKTRVAGNGTSAATTAPARATASAATKTAAAGKGKKAGKAAKDSGKDSGKDSSKGSGKKSGKASAKKGSDKKGGDKKGKKSKKK